MHLFADYKKNLSTHIRNIHLLFIFVLHISPSRYLIILHVLVLTLPELTVSLFDTGIK